MPGVHHGYQTATSLPQSALFFEELGEAFRSYLD